MASKRSARPLYEVLRRRDLLPGANFCCEQMQQGGRTESFLLDHLVGAHKDCFGDGDPEGFRSLEVHDQLESRRALNGKVGRLGATQNSTDVNAATAKHVRKVGTVGDEATCTHMGSVKVYRG